MTLKELLFRFSVNGFCILEDVIAAAECESIRNRVLSVVAREGVNYPSPDNVGFVPGLINHEQSFAPHLVEPRLIELLENMLGHNIRVSFTSAIINEPGNARGSWHADWPFNQNNGGHVPVPYPDAVMHVTTLWMLSPFDSENGGTLVVPGSHRSSTNPTAADCDVSREEPFPGEMHVSAPAGSVLIMDSRLWHSTAPNNSDKSRVALAVRYAPWWLNTEVLRPGSLERRRLVDEPELTDNHVPSVTIDVFESLPENVKPLYRHWVERRE